MKAGDIVYRRWDGVEMTISIINDKNEIYCRDNNPNDIFSMSLKYLPTDIIKYEDYKKLRSGDERCN